jgi:periplasmic divalent cation tolerance protein
VNNSTPQDINGNNKNEFILIISTVNNPDEAKKLAGLLVKEKLAACVSILSPVVSIYRWQNKVETEDEIVLFIKTVKNKYKEVEKLISENHSYEVPEIIALPIVRGEEKYLQWIIDNTHA